LRRGTLGIGRISNQVLITGFSLNWRSFGKMKVISQQRRSKL
jgi:hypothetical protein